MRPLIRLLEKAQSSVLSKWLLNKILSRQIPFNAPHGIKIETVLKDGIQTRLPYHRKNQNHLKGIHACALATLGEFTAGMALIKAIASEDYRLIMKDLRVEYHKQAREAVSAECLINQDWIRTHVTDPLGSAEYVFIPLAVDVKNGTGKLICTVHVNWQIKKWTAVRG